MLVHHCFSLDVVATSHTLHMLKRTVISIVTPFWGVIIVTHFFLFLNRFRVIRRERRGMCLMMSVVNLLMAVLAVRVGAPYMCKLARNWVGFSQS